MLIDDFPFQPVYSVLKTWLWLSMKKKINAYWWFSIPARMLRSKDTPDGCSPRMYQVSIQIRNLPIHNAPQKWSGGHVYDFILSFPVCGTFSPLLLCHRWGGWISYKVISLRYTPVLGSEGAPLSLFLERGRGGGGGKMSVRVKSCNGVTVISKVSNQRWKCIKFNPLFFAGHN